MVMKLKGGNGPVMRAVQKSDVGGNVSHDYVTVQTSGGTTEDLAVDDAFLREYTGATYHREGAILIEGMGDAEVINLDPSVGSVAADGSIIRLSSGFMRILVRNQIITLPLTLDLRDMTDEVDQPYELLSTVAGSLAEHCQAQIDSRIDNTMTMAVNGKVFSTQDHATSNYVRNPNLWCADVDLTCISPWNSNGGVRKAGTLITPRHVMNSAHYEVNVGDTVRFVAADGTVHDRTVAGKKRHPDYANYYPDMTVYTLNADLPAAIKPCKLMPSDSNQYLVQNRYNRPPGLGLDQEEKALIVDLYNSEKYIAFRAPADANRSIFHEDKIVGDSGNPAFMLMDLGNGAELILATFWTYGVGGAGTPVSAHIDTINNVMIPAADAQAGVSTGYTATEADFSAWPNYA